MQQTNVTTATALLWPIPASAKVRAFTTFASLLLSLSLIFSLIINITTLIDVAIIISPVVLHILGILLISVIIISR